LHIFISVEGPTNCEPSMEEFSADDAREDEDAKDEEEYEEV